jgi:hypothetical protein
MTLATAILIGFTIGALVTFIGMEFEAHDRP